MPNDGTKLVTAAVLLIGDEILSGRTRDVNLRYIAGFLNPIGIQVREARVVPDIEAEIIAAVNALRVRYDYVFTTGGIGPTHDDITADAIAKAFGVAIDHHPEALAILGAHYRNTGGEFNEARRRMARIPAGASLIPNSVSKAPGFQIENVFVLAGVPMINQVMLDAIVDRLEGGARMLTRSLKARIGEGQIAKRLSDIQQRHPDVALGSYPYFMGKEYGTSIVGRSVDARALESAMAEVQSLLSELGGEPVEV